MPARPRIAECILPSMNRLGVATRDISVCSIQNADHQANQRAANENVEVML
jgi:hypothetical protein